MSIKRTILAAAAILVAFTVAPASAEMMQFNAAISAESEVPPAKSPAKGTMTATYDTANKTLNYEGMLSGLTGAATAAHFHGPAKAGANAGVLVPLTGVKDGAFKGSVALTDAQAKEFAAGQVYFNVHTAANPNGEARGQVMAGK